MIGIYSVFVFPCVNHFDVHITVSLAKQGFEFLLRRCGQRDRLELLFRGALARTVGIEVAHWRLVRFGVMPMYIFDSEERPPDKISRSDCFDPCVFGWIAAGSMHPSDSLPQCRQFINIVGDLVEAGQVLFCHAQGA